MYSWEIVLTRFKVTVTLKYDLQLSKSNDQSQNIVSGFDLSFLFVTFRMFPQNASGPGCPGMEA